MNGRRRQKKAFERLREKLCSEPVVRSPDFQQEFYLQCDASDVSAASILGQWQSGQEVVIEYWSRKWTGAEKSWAATEKEAACVLMAIRHFRQYIFGMHFTVVTDAKALTHLQTMRTDRPGKMARWAMEMAEYNVTIKHRAGKLSMVPDALSRVVAMMEPDAGEEEEIPEDPWLVSMKRRIVAHPEQFSDYRLEGERLFKYESAEMEVGGYTFCWKEYVPAVERANLVEQIHRQRQHLGADKCLSVIRRNYFWPGMVRYTEQLIRSCEACLRAKRRARNTRVPMGMSRVADRPFELIAMDHWGALPRSELGNSHLLVVVDACTKYVLLQPCRDATAKPVTDFLKNGVFLTFGAPRILLSDNARAFMGRAVVGLLNEFEVEHWSIPYHHAQANYTERYVQTVGTAVRCMIAQGDLDHRTWDRDIKMIEAAINSVPNEATQVSPFKLNFGREMLLTAREYRNQSQGTPREEMTEDELTQMFEELRDKAKTELARAQQRHREGYDRRTRPLTFDIEERVWRRNYALSNAAEHFSHKLADKYVPATVIELRGGDTYIVQDEAGGNPGMYHANDLYKDQLPPDE